MISRRAILQGSSALGLASLLPGHPARAAAGPEGLIARARALAEAPHAGTAPELPPPFDALSYDSYRAIRPIPGRASKIDLGAGFSADLLPPGWLFPDPVTISLPGRRDQIVFDPAEYEFDPRYFEDGAPEGPFPDLRHSGLRVRYPLNLPGRLDDLIVLQGASYFRALAHQTAYGLSARALALGTGGPAPEEFPVIHEIEVFGTSARRLEFGCLIDSPRAAAAFLVQLTPGLEDAPDTVMRCALHLFARETLTDAGIAPLTSMFQHNDMGPARIDDFRPAVHDSDVLVIDNGAGERLWRPLANPATLQMSAFGDDNPRRFGLLQKPDDFASFRDAEGAYHRRPSGMVVPHGDWGKGAVMLLEIPTEDEYADNIVAFWRPAAPLQPGQPHVFDYDLHWQQPGLDALPEPHPLLPVRSASGIEPVTREGRLFVIDFAPSGDAPLPDPATLELVLNTPQGAAITGETLYRVDADNSFLRGSFVLEPEAGTDACELRMQVRGPEHDMAPVWLYRWTRSADGRP